MIYTLIGGAKLNAIDREVCLPHAFERIGANPIDWIDERQTGAVESRRRRRCLAA